MGDSKYTAIGNHNIHSNSVNIANSAKSGEVGQLEDKDDLVNNLFANAAAGVDGEDKDKNQYGELKLLPFTPKWLKILDQDVTDIEDYNILGKVRTDNK